MPPTDDRESELARHRAAIDALDARASRAPQRAGGARAGDRRAQGRRRGLSPGARGAGARAPAWPPIRDRCRTRPSRRIFRQAMSACLALEQTLRVAYLGPPGTYSHEAVAKHFGQSVDMLPCATIDEVFRAAESGATDHAVVPVENSTEGVVGRTLDLMFQTPLTICGEVRLRIRQNLLSTAASLARGRARLFARAVARPMRAMARPASAGGGAGRRGEQCRGGAPRRRASRARPRSPAATRRRSTS